MFNQTHTRKSLLLPVLVVLVSFTAQMWGQAVGQPSTKNGEWPYYTADARGSKYSPLDQINASNFNKLEVAWRFKTDSLGTRPEYKLEGTPLMVKGKIYTTAGTRRAVISLDAKTGVNYSGTFSFNEGRTTLAAIAPSSTRDAACPIGPTCWRKAMNASCTSSTGYRLVELNAKNGALIGLVWQGRNGRHEDRRGDWPQ